MCIDGPVNGPGSTVFVFDRDGEGLAFPSLDEPAAAMEAIDVLDVEYADAFTLAGQVVAIAAVRERTAKLQATGEHDASSLRARLVVACARMNLVADVDDPTAIASEMLREERRKLWPRRPARLHRRVHGDDPPRV
jgi:hypothetical protein